MKSRARRGSSVPACAVAPAQRMPSVRLQVQTGSIEAAAHLVQQAGHALFFRGMHIEQGTARLRGVSDQPGRAAEVLQGILWHCYLLWTAEQAG